VPKTANRPENVERNGRAGTDGRAPTRPATPPRPVTVPTVVNGEEGKKDRDKQTGKFLPGNQAARGNPYHRRLAELRKAFLESATPERVRQLADKLHARALAGDTVSAKIWLTYVLGKPSGVVDPDAVDVDEWRRLQQNPSVYALIAALIGVRDARLAVDQVRALLPGSDEEMLKRLHRDLKGFGPEGMSLLLQAEAQQLRK
jgi:hypothetical protein